MTLGPEKLKALGVPREYHAHARHFEHVFRGLGMSSAQVEAVVSWGAQFRGSQADLDLQLEELCSQQGVELVDLAHSWRGQVLERGIKAMPGPSVVPLSDVDRARMQEIRAEMAKPREESEYWRSAEMRDEYTALLERAAAAGSEGGRDVEIDTRPQATSSGQTAARRAELEGMMRDRWSPYWSGPSSPELQAEYRSLVEPDVAAPAPSGGTSPAAAAPVSGGEAPT